MAFDHARRSSSLDDPGNVHDVAGGEDIAGHFTSHFHVGRRLETGLAEMAMGLDASLGLNIGTERNHRCPDAMVVNRDRLEGRGLFQSTPGAAVVVIEILPVIGTLEARIAHYIEYGADGYVVVDLETKGVRYTELGGTTDVEAIAVAVCAAIDGDGVAAWPEVTPGSDD